MILLAAAAQAATINNRGGAHAPSAYYNASCNAGNCSISGGSTVLCDATSAGGGAVMTAVEDYDGASTRTYSIWGTVNGAPFCCYVDDTGGAPAIASIWLYGSDHADTLAFSFGSLNVTNAARRALGYPDGDTITGSNANTLSDTLQGENGGDTVRGGGGDDHVCGNDCMGGGTSLDTDDCYGDEGEDDVEGDGGADYVDGGDDPETVDGGAGDDEVRGGNGADDVFGGDGADVCYGGANDDVVRGGNGNDDLMGELGDDVLHGEGDDDELLGGDGNDNADGGPGDDALNGGADTDTLYGGNGDDTVCGGGGTSDSLNGGPVSGAPSGTNADDLWVPSTSVTPTGSVVGANAQCGDSAAGFGSWAGTSCGSAPCCTYNLTMVPALCPP